MIDTGNMGIMANFIQQSSNSISTQMISKKDSDKDSSLSVKEMGVGTDIFSSYDSDSNGLVSQSELTTAVNSAMSDFSGGMPSKEDFQSMLSSFGFEAPFGSENTTSSQKDTISSILSEYDANSLSESDAQSIVAAFQKAGIEPSSELESAMSEAGFDAQEVGTLANVGQGGTPPPPPSGGGSGGQMSSSAEDEVFDALDTNEDVVVSLAELQSGYSSSVDETTTASSNKQNALDNLSTLMDMLKSNNGDKESSIDTKSFDGLLKTINNQNNNSNINLYLQNTNTSFLSGYA